MKYYNFKNLKEDEHVVHMWEPLKFKIKDNYKYIPTSFIFNLFSKIALIPIGIILFIFNKIFFGYEKIMILSKKHKEMILNVMNDQLSSKAPLEIYDILKNAGWNLENAIDKLIDNPETPGN